MYTTSINYCFSKKTVVRFARLLRANRSNCNGQIGPGHISKSMTYEMLKFSVKLYHLMTRSGKKSWATINYRSTAADKVLLSFKKFFSHVFRAFSQTLFKLIFNDERVDGKRCSSRGRQYEYGNYSDKQKNWKLIGIRNFKSKVLICENGNSYTSWAVVTRNDTK